MDWNEEMIARLRQLWAEGHSTAEIGRRMGITKNAVVGKAHRLVLPPRPSPIRRDTPEGHVTRRRSAPRRTTGPTLPALSSPAATFAASAVSTPVAAPTPAAPRVAPPPATPPSAVAPASTPAPLRAVPMPRAAARVTTCCWPIGDPGTASFRFCDDDAMTGKPYCAQHAALAYVKVRDRREDAA
jgi:GcrA cell cycle regulator